MHDGFRFGMGWMWIWPLVLVVFLLPVARGLFRMRTGNDPGRPEEILKTRYARGEIDDEEYRRRLDELRKGDRAPRLRGRTDERARQVAR